MKENNSIVAQTEAYVKDLLSHDLPCDIFYHTLPHTQEVVRAVKVIGQREGVSPQEQEILIVSAWFHDVGFVKAYHKHEEASIAMASAFLGDKHYHERSLEQVVAGIGATKIPQKPTSLLEMILCDADLYHLSQPDYWEKNRLLRKELEQCFGTYHQDEPWFRQNLNFLQAHHYFTHYGRTVLEIGKQKHQEENEEIVEELAQDIRK